jgi:redox-sensitive bicupin YhaK (pirin superfamily)
MITIRKSNDRGHANHGWLKSFHTFSFADYVDPEHMSFGPLRVINEDWVAGGSGFPTHPHRDMEILTWVVEGELRHRDSMGYSETLKPGEMQRITAGRGITHSEFNESPNEAVHLLQIWVTPRERGLEPSYEQKAFSPESRQNQLALLASPTSTDGALTIQQDASVYASTLDAGREVAHDLAPNRAAWLQLIKGAVEVNGQKLEPGDAAAVTGENSVTVRAEQPAEFLLFDLAA